MDSASGRGRSEESEAARDHGPASASLDKIPHVEHHQLQLAPWCSSVDSASGKASGKQVPSILNELLPADHPKKWSRRDLAKRCPRRFTRQWWFCVGLMVLLPALIIIIVVSLVQGSKGHKGTSGPPGPQSPDLTVNLGYTQYEGVAMSNGINHWLGMRYAAPPLKDLRFRAPLDPLPAPPHKADHVCPNPHFACGLL
jgi:hypothetical protein